MDKLFASIGLVACLGALLHMALGPVQQRRLRTWAMRLRAGFAAGLTPKPKPVDAAREAEALIRRVSQLRDGNKPPHKPH
jgi:hypothetical protein